MNINELERKQKELTKDMFLPNKIQLAISLVNAFIKNNNIVGLKLAILLSGARNQIKYDKDNKIYFSVDSLCELLLIDKRSLSLNIKKLLNTKYKFILEDGSVGETVPFHTYKYSSDRKDIEICVSSLAKNLFTELKKGKYQFTNILSENLMSLKNKHSLRMQILIETINSYSKNMAKRKKFTLDDFNGFFGTNYKRFVDIERKIIIPVQKEITLSNKITFSYQFECPTNLGIGRPKFQYLLIDVIDNNQSLFAQ